MQKGDPASVSFTNDVDDNMNGGYGVKNNFKLDENGQYQYTEPAEKELGRGSRNEKVT